MKEDYNEADQWLKRAISIAPSPGTKAVWYWANAWTYYWCGNLSQAKTCLDQSYKLAALQDNFFTMAGVDWFYALMDMDIGKYDTGKEHFLKAFQMLLKNSTSPKTDSVAYFVFAGSFNLARGRIDTAKWCLNKINGLLQGIDDPSVFQGRYWSYCLYEDILLSEKNYDSVIGFVEKSKPMAIPEFGYPQVLIYNVPFIHDYLARAYEGLGKTDEAIAEYERLITFNPDRTDRRLINPRYHYYLGMLYEKKGLKDKAIIQYRKFLDLWKDADKIYPEPGDARKRLKSLAGR